jgi:uncharacterized protein YmfQ (DUF2313 family)
MAHSALEYKGLLKRLLPRGKALSQQDGNVLDQVLYALAEEFARLDLRVDDFLNEVNPSTTTELIAEHEYDFGLEWDGTIDLATRREKVIAKLIARGQQDEGYFVEIAGTLAYIVYIDQFKPLWCGIGVSGDACGDQVNLFFWKVNADINKQKGAFSIGFADTDFYGISLLDIRYVANLTRNLDLLIESLNAIKPGHTTALYDFYNVGFSRAFHWGFDAMPINDGTIPIEEHTVDFSSAFTAVGNYDGNYLIGAFDAGFCLAHDAYRGGEFDAPAYDTSFLRPS